jgi:hypothetical protein
MMLQVGAVLLELHTALTPTFQDRELSKKVKPFKESTPFKDTKQQKNRKPFEERGSAIIQEASTRRHPALPEHFTTATTCPAITKHTKRGPLRSRKTTNTSHTINCNACRFR